MPPKRRNAAKKGTRPVKVAKQEPAVQYCVLSGPKNLGTLPQMPMNRICYHLALDEDYVGLNSLRKTKKGCKAGVDAYFSARSNNLPIHSVKVTGFEPPRTSFIVELRLLRVALPLHSYIADLRKRISSKFNIDKMICLTIPVRNDKDPVMEYIHDALSAQVELLNIGGVGSLRALNKVNEMLGETTFDRMVFSCHSECDLDERMCAEIISTSALRSISTIEFFDYSLNRQMSAKDFVIQLAMVVKEGSIYGCPNPFDIRISDWNKIVDGVKEFCGHSKYFQPGLGSEMKFEWKE